MADVVDIGEGRNRKRARKKRSTTALVLAGGGVSGGVYQIGALRALDLIGLNHSVNDFDIYVGTSCGAFVASLVANGARPEDLMVLLDGSEVDGYEPIDLDRLLKPNWQGLAGRAMRMPLDLASIARTVAFNVRSTSVVDVFTMLMDLVPPNLYTLDGLTEMLGRQLRRDGFTDDFRKLEKELYIVATDLDTVEPVVFGSAEWNDVPISRAVAASGALPMVYKGVRIRGREFVDGGLRGFANIEAAVQAGASLVIIVNPITPYVNDRLEPSRHGGRKRSISERGMTSVASQTFKTLVWAAMRERIDHWREVYPGVDFVLIEPQHDDRLMFDTHILNLSQVVQIARHGFESVTVQLGSDFERYREICARHGIKISRRRVIEALESAKGAESGMTRWRRILERTSAHG